MSQAEWWRGAVIYQIYPRSFCDSNGDGVGDIPGIISKLDYIASLGVDAIWVSPFFKSPMKDFGYDISDYRDIDPLFGQLDDFDKLIDGAHQRGIKVIIDQVLSHTSDQHAWFNESRQNQENGKSDWYVWADAKQDGTPPNNWMSIFGGVAWKWEPRRCQYYLHNFLSSQPDLNFHNPDVRQATLDNVEFWLKRGVDGFRLDAINFCYHDAQLRDNPAKPVDKRQGRGFSEDNPYAFQYHYYNNTQPQNLAFMEELRALLNQYPGTAALGEISAEDSLATMAEYTQGGNRLHMGYSFELLTEDFSVEHIRNTVESLENKMQDGWPCWAISNHDVKRVVSRWGYEHNADFAKMLYAMLASLRGSICSYQGEELGLCEADIAFEDLQDPYGITFWPNFKGRDGCRTPHPWEETHPFAGFSTVKPWLPVAPEHSHKAVDKQERQPDSILNSYRHFSQWRKQFPALVHGSIEFVSSAEPVLMFIREQGEQKIWVAFNLSNQKQEVELNENLSPLSDLQLSASQLKDNRLILPPFGSFFALEPS